MKDHPTKNAANLAQSHVRKECIRIDANNEPYVAAELFKPLRGSLFLPENAQMRLLDDELYITWTPLENDPYDWIKLNVLLLNVEEEADMRAAIVPARMGAYRLQSALLTRRGKGLHVYIGFEDSYTEELSDSVYLGKLD